jgi:hypothetical protein
VQLSWGVSTIVNPPFIVLSNKIGGNFIDPGRWRNFCAAGFDHLHQSGHISTEYLHNLLALGILLHLTGHQAMGYSPVIGAGHEHFRISQYSDSGCLWSEDRLTFALRQRMHPLCAMNGLPKKPARVVM